MAVTGTVIITGRDGGSLRSGLGFSGDCEVTGGAVGGAVSSKIAADAGIITDSYSYRNLALKLNLSACVEQRGTDGQIKWIDDPEACACEED